MKEEKGGPLSSLKRGETSQCLATGKRAGVFVTEGEGRKRTQGRGGRNKKTRKNVRHYREKGKRKSTVLREQGGGGEKTYVVADVKGRGKGN